MALGNMKARLAKRPARRRRIRLHVDTLEPRLVMSGLDPQGVFAVGNRPPVLPAIADQQMDADWGRLELALAASDPDGDPITYSARVVDQAYHLDQSLGLHSSGDYIENWGGRHEKWILGDAGWYFLLPDGALHGWDGGGATGPLVATLDPAYYADPARLHDAQPASVAAAVRVAGATLTIDADADAGHAGRFVVVVTADDGRGGTATRSFTVAVTAAQNALTLTPIADLTTIEGTPTSFDLGSFTVPVGDNGPWSVDIDWGDGTSPTSFVVTAPGALGTQMHIYADNAATPYVAVVRVTNRDGLWASMPFRVTVSNAAPTALAGGPYAVTAGQSFSFWGSATDPSATDTAAGLTFVWDFGDGTTASGRGLSTPSHTYAAPGTYTIRLVVTDKDNATSPVALATATVLEAASVPSAPTGPTATAVGSGRIELTWASNNTEEAGFVVERSPDGVAGWVAVATLPANTTHHTDSGLVAATTYFYRVKATNTAGASDWSVTVSATTQAAAPLAAPTNLRVVGRTSSSLEIAWDDNSTGEAGFQVQWSDNGVTWSDYYGTTGPDATGKQLYYLAEGGLNYLRTRAVDGQGGVSNWTETLRARTLLKTPIFVQINGITPRRVSLGWLNASGEATALEVRHAREGTEDWSIAALAADATEATVAGLTPGTAYKFQVRAVNASTVSGWSEPLSGTTPAETLPATPANVRATPLGIGRMDVAFDEVAVADTYEIQRSVDGMTWVTAGVIDASVPTLAVTGLAPGTSLRFRVRAVNDLGASPWSSPVAASTAASAISVTGYDPHFLFSAEKYAALRRMRQEGHPWYTHTIKEVADSTGTPNQTYGDYGQAAAVAYQVEGDPAYAQKAYDEFVKQFTRPYNGYVARIYLSQIAVLSDWIWAGLTPRQQAHLMDKMNELTDAILDPWSFDENLGLTYSDSDEVIGELVGVYLVDQHPYNPRRGERLDAQARNQRTGEWLPIGGLGSTGANADTWRNIWTYYIERFAKGGAWFESSDYDMHTLYFLAMGVPALESVAGQGHFDDVKAFLRDAAMVQLYSVTPDLLQRHQWGNDEHPRTLRVGRYVDTLMALAGAMQGDEREPYLNQMVQDLAEEYGYGGSGVYSSAMTLLLFDPYSPRADWRTLPADWFASGQGLLLHKDVARNNLLAVQTFEQIGFDHWMSAFGDVQLYREGEWVLTHPVGHAYTAMNPPAHNSMMIAGLGPAAEFQEVIARATTPAYVYQAMQTHGGYYPAGPDGAHTGQPPVHLHEWTRSTFYLPAADGSADALIVFDRTDAEDPRDMLAPDQLARYWNSGDISRMNAPVSRKQWYWHTPTHTAVPTIFGNRAEWSTDGGQQVQLEVFGSQDLTLTAVDEVELWGDQAMGPLGWHIEVRTQADRRWDTGLALLTMRDGGVAAPTGRFSQSSAGQAAQGVLVQRAGQSDALVVFGAIPTPLERLITTGYAISWTQDTAAGELYLVDLDPSKSWAVSLDGGPSTPLEVSPAGIGHLTVGGAGAHTLTLTAAGAPAAPARASSLSPADAPTVSLAPLPGDGGLIHRDGLSQQNGPAVLIPVPPSLPPLWNGLFKSLRKKR